MGVVRDWKNYCETAKTSSAAESVHSDYSSHAQSDNEEQEEHPRCSHRRPLVQNNLLNLSFNHFIRKNCGKRKARHILNCHMLETLTEEDEIPEIYEITKSKFQLLLEESDNALELLESYEREQESNKDKLQEGGTSKNHNAYFNIPRKIRTAIKNRKNFQYDLLKSIEHKLTPCTPSQVVLLGNEAKHIYEPESCYERLLVHAVAKYKGFTSETIILNNKKVVCISNWQENHKDSNILLCDLIKLMKI